MAISPTTPPTITSFSGPAPNRTDPATFSARTDARLGEWQPNVDETNAAIDWENSTAQEVYGNAVEGQVSAASASSSAAISAANANFKGLWVDQTGVANVPYSVSHSGVSWQLINNIADVTLSEPSVSGDWLEISLANPIVKTPVNVSPSTGDTVASLNPLLTGDAYANIYDKAHASSQFVVYAADGVTVLDDSGVLGAVESYAVVTTLSLSTSYKWSVTYTDIDGNASTSGKTPFDVPLLAIVTPVVTCTGTPSDVPETPTLASSAFESFPVGQVHLNTDWQVLDGATVVWESLADAVNLLSISVPAGVLLVSTDYTFQARHRSVAGDTSAYGVIDGATSAAFDIVPLMSVSHGSSPFVTIYNQDVDAFNKLTDPSNLPAGTGSGVAFSSDDVYMSVTSFTSPYITIYKRSGDTFTKLANPSVLPTGTGYGVAFSSDDVYMSVSHGSSPFVTIYKRSGDTFTKLPNPSSLPASTGSGVAFSSDGVYMSVAHFTSPYITIYKRSGDTFTKLANPSVLPTGIGLGVAFSSDNTYMSVAHDQSPNVTIYKRSGDTFTKLANPSVLPTNAGNSVAFSPDNTYMSVAHTASPFITTYKRSGDVFTKLTDPVVLPAGTGNSVAFSSDGAYMSVAHTLSPFITTYKRSGDTFTKLANPDTLPAGTGNSVAFSNTGYPQ